MKKHKILFYIIVLALVIAPHAAQAKRRYHTPHKPHHHAAGVDGSAAYADILIDAETGRVLHASDPDGLRHPASLTKMMTLYITFEALESGRLTLNQSLPISENASYQSPSKLGLHAGQHIRVEDAILGLVTESANDAAVVLGEALGGSEDKFGEMMTRQAHALGMTQTVFRNPSGLPDPDQVTTAHDMAVLGDALVTHYPQFYPYFSHDSFTYAGIYHHNHNHLMDRYDGMDGIKTGYIRASGFNLVASAKRDGVRVIGVVFGGHSAVARDNKMAELLDEAFPVALAERRSGHISQADGEGDASDGETGDYIALPSKVAAIFPTHGQVVNSPSAEPDTDDTPTPTAKPASPRALRGASIQAEPRPPEPAVKPQSQPQVQAVQATVHIEQPVPPHPVQTGNNWGIQIGAYSDAAIGQQAIANLVASMPEELGKGDVQIQPVASSGVTMYRARLMALDKKTAQNTCSYLIQHGKSCLTVEP